MTFMHRHVGKNEYHEIFNFLQDSVRSWTANGLGYFSFLNVSMNYRIDSLLCFNEKKNKMVGAIPMQQLLPDGVQDDIWFLFGVKIDQDWYFLSGSTVVLPRKYYQKDIHTPLSWEKLSELSMKHIFSGYLKKNQNGEWQINDRFFDDIVHKNINTTGYDECFECKSGEEYVMYMVRENWRQKDTSKVITVHKR
jgi:hypothetical protein